MVRDRWMYVFILPGVLYFLIFNYLPLLGNVIAFQQYSPFLGFQGSPWVGLDNFRRLRGFGWPGFSSMRLWRQDKGQDACARAFVEAIARGDVSPIPLDEVIEVSRVSIEAQQALS